MNREREYAYLLTGLPGIGNASVNALMEAFGSFGAAMEADEEELLKVLPANRVKAVLEGRKNHKPLVPFEELTGRDIHMVLCTEKEYPKRLSMIPDKPYVIFYKGSLPTEDRPSVAVVGARECSEYGKYAAKIIGENMGRLGVSVISGMARGIDGISQKAALDAGGRSFAVLGSGVDICYPEDNRRLYDYLAKKGGIISSYHPGSPAIAKNFPPRNRIVSGLADVVIVVEAREKSGTFITVDMALEQGREVYVVPGRITDRLSVGCNRLWKQGASIFLSVEEFTEELMEIWERKQGAGRSGFRGADALREGDGSVGNAAAVGNKQSDDFTGTQQSFFTSHASQILPADLAPVYDLLDFYPQSVSDLLHRADSSLQFVELNRRLMQLCVLRVASQVSPGYFVKKM